MPHGERKTNGAELFAENVLRRTPDKVLKEHCARKSLPSDMNFDSLSEMKSDVTAEIAKLSPKRRLTTDSRKWRRGDSNPRRTETQPLHISDNSATNCSEKPLEGNSEKQSHDSSEHFNALSQQEFGANMVRGEGRDSDLTEIVAVWPDLPGAIKAAIKALVQAYHKGVE